MGKKRNTFIYEQSTALVLIEENGILARWGNEKEIIPDWYEIWSDLLHGVNVLEVTLQSIYASDT